MLGLNRPLLANLILNPIITLDIITTRFHIPTPTPSAVITVFTIPIAVIGGSPWVCLFYAHFYQELLPWE
jgi:hypothetical protein